jgi:hypothetical protein
MDGSGSRPKQNRAWFTLASAPLRRRPARRYSAIMSGRSGGGSSSRRTCRALPRRITASPAAALAVGHLRWRTRRSGSSRQGLDDLDFRPECVTYAGSVGLVMVRGARPRCRRLAGRSHPRLNSRPRSAPGLRNHWLLHRDSQLHSVAWSVCSGCLPDRDTPSQRQGEVMELIAADHQEGSIKLLAQRFAIHLNKPRPRIGRLGVAVRRKAVTAGSVAADRRGTAASFRCPRARRCGNARHKGQAGRIAPSRG